MWIRGCGSALFVLTLLYTFHTLLDNCKGILPLCEFRMQAEEFPPISVSSINCNSLNMSNLGIINHKLKIYGITRLKSDIILLSDIRLNSNINATCIPTVRNSFRINPYAGYDFYHHSTMSKRGVGILIKKSSCFSVSEEWRDPDENCLLLRITVEGNNRSFIIGCIYGPNHYEPRFFEFLRDKISGFADVPIILGGDWNCTASSIPARDNPDLINMNNLPNKRHSDLLNSMCDDFDLCEPYRTLYPNRIEHTYIPSDPLKRNRSRIDFFLVSKNLVTKITECSIATGLQNKLFDHKAIYLS